MLCFTMMEPIDLFKSISLLLPGDYRLLENGSLSLDKFHYLHLGWSDIGKKNMSLYSSKTVSESGAGGAEVAWVSS